MKTRQFVFSFFLLLITIQLWSQIDESEIAITASSTLPSSQTSNFNPENIVDGTNASWSEGVKGAGVGEFIQVDFRYPDEMKFVMIKNGFGKEKYWKANGRIRKMSITNEEGESRVIMLEDRSDLQVAGLIEMNEDEDHLLSASEGLYGNSFTFEIIEVYPGERWQDVCLTEMNFNLWYMDMFPMSSEYIYKNLFRVYFDGVFDRKGALYIESDWDGYINIDVEDGYYFSEITSGDGTSGYNEYQIFINEVSDEYYLFHSELLSEISDAGMEGKTGEDGMPETVKTTSWEFYLYDPEYDIFNELNESDLDDLFIIHPSGDVWLSRISSTLLQVNSDSGKNKIYYEWDGNKFMKR